MDLAYWISSQNTTISASNTYRYTDVINNLLTRHNNCVHSTIGMPPTKVNPSSIYSVWKRINSLWTQILQDRVTYKLRDLEMITKEKVKFDKVYEQSFWTEIFQVVKVIHLVPNLITNCQTYKIVPSKANFTITNFSRSLHHPRPRLK